MNFTVVCDIAS